MRTAANRPCAACGGTVDEGFLLDRRRNFETSCVEWIEGETVRSWLGTLRVRGRRRGATIATRCRKCGRLELSAPELSG